MPSDTANPARNVRDILMEGRAIRERNAELRQAAPSPRRSPAQPAAQPEEPAAPGPVSDV